MTYTAEYYRRIKQDSLSAAQVILPIVFDVLAPDSLADVGCGTGSWLSVAVQLGADDVLGVDGDWVDVDALLFPKEKFLAYDLRKPMQLDRRFDVALSLEVAEHLPGPSADVFVQTLVSLAPAVLFSAAIPKQSGVGHLNEQWQSYWAKRFALHGYRPIDLVRHRVWNDPRVAPRYAQNLLLYCHHSLLARSAALKGVPPEPALALDLVHPHVFANATDVTGYSTSTLLKTSFTLARALPQAVCRSFQRRWTIAMRRVMRDAS